MKDVLIHGLIGSVVLKNVWKGVKKGSTWGPWVIMILLHGWVKKTHKRLCRQKCRDYRNNKLSDPRNKTANIWSYINSVSGRGKRSYVDGIQSFEFQSFLLKKVELANNSIRARKKPIYLAHAQEGGLSRLQDVDEDELLKAIQRLPNKQCASDLIPTWILKKTSRIILPFVKSKAQSVFFVRELS